MKTFPAFCRMVIFLIYGIILAAAAAAEGTHAVKSGESLSIIAKKYHVTIGQIKEANGLDDSLLQPGQTLTIPGTSGKSTEEGTERKNRKKDFFEEPSLGDGDPDTHLVRPGDTLGRIAKKYHLSVEELKEMNQLRGDRLKVGRPLVLRPMGEGDEEIEGETAGSPEGTAETKQESASATEEEKGVFAEAKEQQSLVRAAKTFLGAKYKKGGSHINGMDCSAYVQKVFWIFGVDLPRTAREQFKLGTQVARDALHAGDLLFFKRSRARHPTHVAIYLGKDQFIHTSLSKRQVQIDSLDSRYFRLRFLGAKRIVGQNNSMTSADLVYNEEK